MPLTTPTSPTISLTAVRGSVCTAASFLPPSADALACVVVLGFPALFAIAAAIVWCGATYSYRALGRIRPTELAR